MSQIVDSVLCFWFGSEVLSPAKATARMPTWFEQDGDFDYDIERRFGKLVSLAASGRFDDWEKSPKSTLALIILLDQFPRNLYRGTAKAFATDAKALTLTKYALEQNYADSFSPIELVFLLMPFQHAEDLDDQTAGMELYKLLAEHIEQGWRDVLESTYEFAQRHHAIIEQFGRFPHRNSALGRIATPEEITYMEQGGESF